MALHHAPAQPLEVRRDRERIVELLGTSPGERRVPRPGVVDAPTVLAAQLRAIGSIVEVVRLRAALADSEQRIGTLVTGIRIWRERAESEAAARRQDQREAHAREREVVGLLHQQMVVADAAMSELEDLRSRSWWHRLRG